MLLVFPYKYKFYEREFCVLFVTKRKCNIYDGNILSN